jgi:transposase-like protein
MTPEQIQSARTLLIQPDNSVSSIAKLLGVSRSTIYKYIPELTKQPAPPLEDEQDDETESLERPPSAPVPREAAPPGLASAFQ